MNPGKYGPVESSFIRYLLLQNEMLHKENVAQLKLNTELQKELLLLAGRFNDLLKHTLSDAQPPSRKGGG